MPEIWYNSVPFSIFVKSKVLLFHFLSDLMCVGTVHFVHIKNCQLGEVWGTYYSRPSPWCSRWPHATRLHSFPMFFVQFHFRRCSWTYLKIEEEKMENFTLRFNRPKTSFNYFCFSILENVAKWPRIASHRFQTLWHLLWLNVKCEWMLPSKTYINIRWIQLSTIEMKKKMKSSRNWHSTASPRP